jgi:sugar/nucleoside kinase (ribokinase family)
LPYIDYLVPSIDEASEMAGANDPVAVARWFKAKGVRNCILTFGGDGAVVAPENGPAFHTLAFEAPVSDTTGFGDAFTVVGIIVGIAKGWSLTEVVRFANAVSAKVARGLGSQGKLVSFDDTMRAMNSLAQRQPSRAYAA